MICERCHKRKASLKYTEVVRGKATLRNICESCLGDLQRDPAGGFELAGVPTAKIAAALRQEGERVVAQRECPSCGISLLTVAKEGRVGCVNCFAAFGELVDMMVRSSQYSQRHAGSGPNSLDGRDQLRVDLRTKRSLLRNMLQAEHYEEAAVLRDEIRELEAALGSSAGSD